MRLLLLVLNIVVSMSLSTNTTDALAASIDSQGKDQKQYHAYIKEKTQNNSNDIWERIRLGMKINLPSPTQVLSRQTLIPKRNNLSNIYSLHSERHTPTSETIPTENTGPEQPIDSKYIIRPHTAIAPLHNYTDLGRRLRFGNNTPSAITDNCIPIISTQARQEQTLKSKNNGILQPEPEMTPPLPQTTNNISPCIKRNSRHLVGINKQEKQRDIAEQNNTKKAMINERVNKHIALFSQSPGYLYQVAERARPYLYHIVEGLSKNQLPLDLALLPIVESAYQPTALSPKGAAGLWQFIPGTGKDYDLKQSKQYDERLDILASTQAAIRYLSDLKDHFNGDWLLALAAYNCGQGAVDNAISRNLSEGLDADYWSLRLPQETQDYVPRLLALSTIFAKPAIYGLKFTPIKNEPYFIKVKIDREIDIKYLANKNVAVLAKLVGMSHEQFSRLNPGYLNSTLSTKGSYTFLLPLAKANQLQRLLTSIAQFMAEPVSQTMNGALKTKSPNIVDYVENREPKVGALDGVVAERDARLLDRMHALF